MSTLVLPRTQAQLVMPSPDVEEDEEKDEEEKQQQQQEDNVENEEDEERKNVTKEALYPFEGRDSSELTFGVGEEKSFQQKEIAGRHLSW